jgi:hypothetical protein
MELVVVEGGVWDVCRVVGNSESVDIIYPSRDFKSLFPLNSPPPLG